MSENPLNDIDIESIMGEVVAGAQAHSAATERFVDTFMFYDKTLNEWLDEMAMQRPPENPGPHDMQVLYMDLAMKIQRASNFYTIANAIHGSLSNGSNIKKSDLVNALVNQYARTNAKRPAATIIEKMADSYMNGTVHTRIAAKVVKDFWKERRDTLIEMRKCFEQASISIAIEMKHQD